MARVEALLGPIEILVNNAGITRDAMLHKMTAEQWREVIDVDLGGCSESGHTRTGSQPVESPADDGR